MIQNIKGIYIIINKYKYLNIKLKKRAEIDEQIKWKPIDSSTKLIIVLKRNKTQTPTILRILKAFNKILLPTPIHKIRKQMLKLITNSFEQHN